MVNLFQVCFFNFFSFSHSVYLFECLLVINDLFSIFCLAMLSFLNGFTS